MDTKDIASQAGELFREFANYVEDGIEAILDLSTIDEMIVEFFTRFWKGIPVFILLLVLLWPILLTIAVFAVTATGWLVWITTKLFIKSVQFVYAAYHFTMIWVAVTVMTMMSTFSFIWNGIKYHVIRSGIFNEKHLSDSQRREVRKWALRKQWKQELSKAQNYENYKAIEISEPLFEGDDEADDILDVTPILEATAQLRESREYSSGNGYLSKMLSSKGLLDSDDNPDTSIDSTRTIDEPDSLNFLLPGALMPNHLGMNKALAKDSRFVLDCGQHVLSAKTRKAISDFNGEVEKSLEWVAESSVCTKTKDLPPDAPLRGSLLNSKRHTDFRDASLRSLLASPAEEFEEKMTLLKSLKHNNGKSALMLSGGGALAMFHLGTIKALIESDAYKGVNVISGASGGSIAACMCALKTPEELLRDVCVSHVSTDYQRTGRMKKENIRWFPKVMDMVKYFMENGLVVDSKEFQRTCDFYYGTTTFGEAYKKTGKHVCITVSASRGSGGQRLLLNHISTPHVTLASAVVASCALPGVFSPARLVTKNVSNNRKEKLEVDSVEWIDGSIEADLPFKRISTMFNVTNFIVSQVNPHISPLLKSTTNQRKAYNKIFKTLEWSIRTRALSLSRLGLFPKLAGQDIANMFKQRFHGDMTLLPTFRLKDSLGLTILVNPEVEDMEVFLHNGEVSVWPYISAIKERLRCEQAIDKCFAIVQKKAKEQQISQAYASSTKNLKTITQNLINRTREVSAHREKELLEGQVQALKLENTDLKLQLQKVYAALGVPFPAEKGNSEEERLSDETF